MAWARDWLLAPTPSTVSFFVSVRSVRLRLEIPLLLARRGFGSPLLCFPLSARPILVFAIPSVGGGVACVAVWAAMRPPCYPCILVRLVRLFSGARVRGVALFGDKGGFLLPGTWLMERSLLLYAFCDKEKSSFWLGRVARSFWHRVRRTLPLCNYPRALRRHVCASRCSASQCAFSKT